MYYEPLNKEALNILKYASFYVLMTSFVFSVFALYALLKHDTYEYDEAKTDFLIALSSAFGIVFLAPFAAKKADEYVARKRGSNNPLVK